MPEIISDADTDAPPVMVELPANSDSAKLCAYPGCTNEIVSSGRGRPPKYCPEHTGAKHATTTSSKSSGPSWPQAATVEKALLNYLDGITLGVGFLNAEDSKILATNGPAVVHELVELGRTDKTMRKYLTSLAAPGKYGPLSLAVFGLVFPIAVNHNLIPFPKLMGGVTTDTAGGV